VRVYCEKCEKHFDAELPFEVMPVSAGSGLHLTMPHMIPVPKGWYQKYSKALCPDHNPHPPRPEEKETPTAEILEKAQKLQALAMDKAAGEGERANAWTQFEKLWKKYELPPELGLEFLED
jgi:hypothetical protein